MRIAILAHGARGDIQPAVIIGDRLMRRGHHVTLAVNRDLAGFAAGAGLDVRPSGLDVGGFLRSPEADAGAPVRHGRDRDVRRPRVCLTAGD